MNLLDFPLEILGMIGEQLDSRDDLEAASKICKALYGSFDRENLVRNIRHYNSSALLWAAKTNRLPLARRLLQLGADPDAGHDGYVNHSPICAAADAGHFSMVKLLLWNGADITVGDYRTVSWAFFHRDEETVILFIKKMHSNPNAPINFITRRRTCLQAACEARLPEAARAALECGADVNQATEARIGMFSSTPLHLALGYQTLRDQYDSDFRALTLIMLLLEYEAIIDDEAIGRGQRHPNPLIRAVMEGPRRVASVLRIPPPGPMNFLRYGWQNVLSYNIRQLRERDTVSFPPLPTNVSPSIPPPAAT